MVKKLKVVETPRAPVDVATPFSEENRLAMRAMEKQLINTKVALADLTIQQKTLEERKAALMEQVTTQSNALVIAIRAAAVERGIDPDAPEGGPKWHFDLDTCVFTRRA